MLVFVAATASAQEKIKLPISASSKTLGYSPLWVASKQGFFDKQGLDAQVVLVSGADKSTMALVGGSVYVASGGDRRDDRRRWSRARIWLPSAV